MQHKDLTSPQGDGGLEAHITLASQLCGPSARLYADLPVVPEQDLLMAFFPRKWPEGVKAYPVATLSFLVSAEKYPPPWCSREVMVQNFVDGNVDFPGTLNGVEFREENIGSQTRLSVFANWRFANPTALISPHSSKPSGRRKAGGNGLATKQLAVLLLRDADATRFEFQGDGWDLNYTILCAKEVNAALPPGSQQVENDWVVALVTPAERRTWNKVIIETAHPAMIAALQTAPELGVSDTNPHLVGMVTNEFGGTRWLAPGKDGTVPRGRVFINGQVMQCGEINRDSNDYWGGARGFVVTLKDNAYDISIDRPSLTVNELMRYMTPLVRSWSEDELRAQLKKSEPLWTLTGKHHSYPEDHLEYHSLIAKIVDRLRDFTYLHDRFISDFREKGSRYICSEGAKPTKAELAYVDREGLIIIPNYFKSIGVPLLSQRTNVADRLAEIEIGSVHSTRRFYAEHEGIIVYGAETTTNLTPESFAQLLTNELRDTQISFSEDPPNIMTLSLAVQIPTALLTEALPHPKTPEETLLYSLRGLIRQFLRQSLATKVVSVHSEYGSIYAVDPISPADSGELMTRIEENPGGEYGRFLLKFYLRPEIAPQFIDAVRGLDGEAAVSTGKAPTPKVSEAATAHPEVVQRGWRSTWIWVAGCLLALSAPLWKGPTERSGMEPKKNPPPESLTPKNLTPENLTPESAKLRPPLDIPSKDIAKPARALEVKTTSTLLDIIRENNLSKVPENPDEVLKDGPVVLSHPIKNFSTVKMTPLHRQRFQILITYFEIATNIKFENDIFVFKGEGAKGLNKNKRTIGLHDALLNAEAGFDEAFSTFVHEVAHNHGENHDSDFRTCQQALQRRVLQTVREVGLKAKSGAELTMEERFLLTASGRW